MKPTKANNRRSNKAAANKTFRKPLVFFTLIMLALAVLLVVSSQLGDNAQQEQALELPPIHNQPVLGDESAPVTVVEFGDYKCPSCKAWSETFFPVLKRDYIDTGKVKLVYIHTPFHGAESELAALAAEAVWAQDPQAFWTYSKAIYEVQPQDDHDVAWVTKETLLAIAEAAVPHIDLSRLADDIDSGRYATELEIDIELVQTYNVQFTPSVMIDGYMLDNPFDYDKASAWIERQLGKSKR